MISLIVAHRGFFERFLALRHRARIALTALWRRSSAVSFAARALPPIRPPFAAIERMCSRRAAWISAWVALLMACRV